MGSIVSVKQRARKKTIAITAFGSQIYQMPSTGNVGKVENFENDKNIPKVVHINKVRHGSKNGALENNYRNDGIIEKKRNENVDGEFLPKDEKFEAEFDRGRRETELLADSRGKVFEKSHNQRGVEAKNDINENLSSQRESISDVDNFQSFSPENMGEKESPIENHQLLKTILTENVALPLHEDMHKKSSPTRHIKEWFKAVDSSGSGASTRTPSPMHVALGSWGDGVVTATDNKLQQQQGRVTSRGLEVNVQSSSSFYSDFAHVTNVHPRTPDLRKTHKPKTLCRGVNNGCKCKNCEADRRKAAVIIQSILRGHQVRKEMQKRRSSVIKIQRLFRERVESSGGLKVIQEEKRNESQVRKISTSSKPWQESPTSTQIWEPQIGEKTKESFEMYQDDITELKWRSQQLIETATMGEDYVPQKILLIASNVGKAEFLARVSLENIHVIIYQFAEINLGEILQNISLALDDYRVGSKAKRIAFVCQGGPGYMYLCRGKVLTTAKLAKDPELQRFVKGLGGYLSKIKPVDAKIHIIGNNILGSKKGVKLFEALTETIKPNRCSVESPLELSADGVDMLQEYFDIEKYKMWKRIKNTKIWL